MILAAELNKYTKLTKHELAQVLARSGYTGCSFETVKFVGLTNGGQFCYSVTYYDEAGTGVEVGKVYVCKSATGDMAADY